MSKRKSKNKINLDGGDEDSFGNNPFGGLSSSGLPEASKAIEPIQSQPKPKKKNRGRVDVKREKSGRGGKTVTVIYGMQMIERREREQLLKKMKSTCGVGGTLKDSTLEVQGDNREKVGAILEDAGFRVVYAGG